MPDPIDWGFAAPYLIGALLFGYILGATPFGLIFTRLAGLGDIRSMGSGNIGTTNVLRTGRKDLAALTLIGDGLKGAVAYLLAANFGPDTAVLAGFGAFIGHLFPFWLKFRGGKGVATFIGVLFAASWQVGIAFAVIWLILAFAFRYASFSALISSLASSAFLAWRGEWQLAEVFGLMTLLLWIMHGANIRRLLSGTESRLGTKSAPQTAGTPDQNG